jgi:hypothetical protein
LAEGIPQDRKEPELMKFSLERDIHDLVKAITNGMSRWDPSDDVSVSSVGVSLLG